VMQGRTTLGGAVCALFVWPGDEREQTPKLQVFSAPMKDRG
jgi:hypothetical protein